MGAYRAGRLKLFKDIENSGYFRPGAVRLVKFSFAYLLVMHILASFYWFVAASGINVECNDQGGKSNWVLWECKTILLGQSHSPVGAFGPLVLLATIGENMGANQPWQHAFSIFMIVIGHLINVHSRLLRQSLAEPGPQCSHSAAAEGGHKWNTALPQGALSAGAKDQDVLRVLMGVGSESQQGRRRL